MTAAKEIDWNDYGSDRIGMEDLDPEKPNDDDGELREGFLEEIEASEDEMEKDSDNAEVEEGS